MRPLFRMLITAFLLSYAPLLLAGPILIDFEGLADSELVTTQYPGLVFSNAVALTAGISLNEFEFPPYSGVNVLSDDGAVISIEFAVPVLSSGGYFTYLAPLTLTAFDAFGNTVDTSFSIFSNNMVLSGDSGSSPNEFLLVAFAGGIARVSIVGDPGGYSFTLDDMVYTPIPEPNSFTFLLAGLAALIVSRAAIRT